MLPVSLGEKSPQWQMSGKKGLAAQGKGTLVTRWKIYRVVERYTNLIQRPKDPLQGKTKTLNPVPCH